MAEKTTVVNVRLPQAQARWLRNLADAEHGGNLSAAARRALTDAWMMRRCREEYEITKDPGVRMPLDEGGPVPMFDVFLSSWGARLEVSWDEQDAESI